MLAIIVLLSAHLLHGHHFQEIHGSYTAKIQGICQSGDECNVDPLRFPDWAAFGSQDFSCYGNSLPFPNVENFDTALEFYPADKYGADVQFTNDTGDDFPSGTPVRIAYTCSGLK